MAPTKDDDCDVDRAEDSELVGLLEQTIFALERVGQDGCQAKK
jgi:hypothetical protein